MPDRAVLPELARSLRTLGAPHDAAAVAAHTAVFTPLLDARASAATSDADGAQAALRGSALAARIGAQVVDAAQGDITDPAHARAKMAEADEIMEPLRAALLALDEAVVGAIPGSEAWDRWVAQLRRVFTTADVACGQLAALLRREDHAPVARRWFERGIR